MPTPANPPRAFVASATRIRLSDKPQPRKTQEWQQEAWTAYECVGEVQHAVDFIANHISKVRLFPAFVPTDPRDQPRADIDNEAGELAITQLRTEGGEYAAILRELTINLYVAGECYLVGKGGAEDNVAFWEIRSTDELSFDDQKFYIREYPSASRTEYFPDQIIVIHIMFPHPRWGRLPLSPIRGVLASAEEIQRIERVIRAAAKSRSAGPGLLLMPDEASFGNTDPTTDSAGGAEALNDPFMKALMDAMITPIEDEGSASAVVPLLVRAPADVLKEIRKVSLSIDIDTELIKLERALTRLAQGLPLPPEIVTGKEGLSHWTSWSVDESVVTSYIEPVLAPIVSALTIEYYRPFLMAMGATEEEARRRMLWYDVTALVTRPNRSADADFGLEHIALSDDAWRRVKGFTEADAPVPLERLARLLMQRGSLDPVSTVTLLQLLGIVPQNTAVTNRLLPPTPSPGPGQRAESRDPPDRIRPSDDAPPRRAAASVIYLPSAGPDADSISIGLAELDRELRIRLQTAAEVSLSRALDKASSVIASKLRTRNRYSTLIRETPRLECASRIGRPNLESEGIQPLTLFSNAFDSLRSKFIDWSTRTYSKAARLLAIQIPTPTDSITSAADNFIAFLTSFAVEKLFDPSYGADPHGENDDSASIPHGIVRQGLYHAGGGTTLLPSDYSPPSAIATGAHVLRSLLDAGGSIDGWEWCYSTSVRTRDFSPHAALNGVRFSSWSDPILANRSTWPPVTSFYPGDHESCFCQARPILSLPNPSSATISSTDPESAPQIDSPDTFDTPGMDVG